MKWNPDKIRVQLARDLREIRRLYANLRAEAVARAHDADIPGGPAMVMLGPSADPEAWTYAELSAIFGRTEAHGEDELESDPQPPLLVLATWEDAIRDELGTRTNRKATIEDAAGYIASAIDWMLDEDENGDINFLAIDEVARDVARVRRGLEGVLRDGEQRDTGAPCIECSKPLVKVWSEAAALDSWECRNLECELRGDEVSPERYKNAVRADYLAHSDRLTASDMLEAYRIKPGTLRQWANRGKVAKRGRDASGRMLYDVADALNARDRDMSEQVV